MTNPAQIPMGWDQIGFATKEATWGTIQDTLTTSAFEFSKLSMGGPQLQRRATAKHKSGKRGYTKIVKGRKDPIPITITTPIMPSGVVDVAPDITDILEVAMGSYVLAGNNHDYEFSDTPIVGMTLAHGDATFNWAEWAFGVVFTQIRITAGEEEVEIEFSGMAASKCSIMAATTADGADTNAVEDPAVLTMASNEAYRAVGLGGAVVDVAATSEILTLAVNDNAIWSLTRAQYGTSKIVHTENWVVQPYLPAQTLNSAAAPIGEQEGTYTLHGKTIYPSGYSFEVNTGLKHRKFQKGSATRRGMLAEPAPVTGTVTLLLDREMAEFFGRAAGFVESTLSFVEGDTTYSKFTTDGGVVHVTVPDDVEFPDDGSEIEVELGLELFGWDNDDSPIRFRFS